MATKDIKQALREKLAALADDKVLDVSTFNYDPVKRAMTGVRVAKRPVTSGAESKGVKKLIPGLNIISDNYETYKQVADYLGQPKFATEYNRLFGVRGARPERKTPQRGPKRTLAEKLQIAVDNANEKGNLVDVSALTAAGGFRTVDGSKFGEGYKGQKVGFLEELPIISNNYSAYELAAVELGRENLARRYMETYGDEPAKSPAASRGAAKSPGLKRNAEARERLELMYTRALEAGRANPDKYPNGAQLDVSRLTIDGKGSRIVKVAANPRGRSTKFSAGDNIMISDSITGFQNVGAILGGDFRGYAENFARDQRAGLHRAPEKKSPRQAAGKRPVITRSKSPVRSGRSLSPFPRIGTQSPVRGGSRAGSQGRAGTPSPVRARTPSPIRARTPSPVRTRSASPRSTGLLNIPNRF